MSSVSTKLTYLAFAASLVAVGCSGAPQTSEEIQTREMALSRTPAPPDPIPTGRHITPPAPPVPVEPPPPVCLQIAPCLSGLAFDSSPSVCSCVPIVATPGTCVQLTQCMAGQTYDETPGICRCVPAG